MKCEQCDRHLSALLDDELTSELKAEVLQHVGQCSSCHSALDQLRAVDKRLANLRLSDNVVARLVTATENDSHRETEASSPISGGRHWNRAYVPWVLAAVAACIAEEKPDVVGLSSVVTTRQPVAVVATVPKMQYSRPPAMISGSLQQHSGIGGFG